MNSNIDRFPMNTSHQYNFNSVQNNYSNELLAYFNAKIKTEKKREDKELFIPNSPDLKFLMGKTNSKENLFNTGNLKKISIHNQTTKFKANNIDYVKTIEVIDTFRINSELNNEIYLTEKDDCKNFRTEEIFSTSSSLNVEEESIERKFRNTTENFIIHKLIFDKDLENLSKLLLSFESNKDFQSYLVNHLDFRGNSPLTLCVILRSIDKCQEYLVIIQELLKYDVNPKLKNFKKSTALEIATSFEDSEAVKLIFEYLLKRRRLKIERNEIKAGNFLAQIPDIYLEMTWEVNVPLLKFMCPSDTCKLWKMGKNIRMDYSFQQFKNLSSVRCPSSYVFRTDEVEDKSNHKVYQINHKNHIYFNPFEAFDEEEKELIVKDILNSHRIEGEFKLKKCSVAESKSYFGKKPVYDKINKINAQKYEVNIAASVNLKNKEKCEYENISKDFYFNRDEELKFKTHLLMDQNKLKNHLANGLKVKNDKLREELMKLDNKEKSLKAYVWIAENFPIKSSYLVTMFNSISGANEFTQKIKEFLNDPEIKKIINKNGFPIKIVIPINFFIDVSVTFTKFFEIGKDNKQYNIQELYNLPENYTQVPRKSIQDLKTNAKKRMGYANIQG